MTRESRQRNRLSSCIYTHPRASVACDLLLTLFRGQYQVSGISINVKKNTLEQFIFALILSLYFIFLCVGGYRCHGVHVEVRGQLVGFGDPGDQS